MVFFVLPFESKIGFEFAVDLKRKPNQGFISKYFMSLGLVMVMIMEIMMIMVINDHGGDHDDGKNQDDHDDI